jgi:hypothetical protein
MKHLYEDCEWTSCSSFLFHILALVPLKVVVEKHLHSLVNHQLVVNLQREQLLALVERQEHPS